MDLEKLKYPIGNYSVPANFDAVLIQKWISDIEAFPQRMTEELSGLNEEQLNTPYRPGGWSLRQLANHCSDSHMNSLIRFKLALTEEQPTIKPYHEERWAELEDSKNIDIEPALKILDGLHARWVHLLRSLKPEELSRVFVHPASQKNYTLLEAMALYSWHCRHHLAHVTELKKRNGW